MHEDGVSNVHCGAAVCFPTHRTLDHPNIIKLMGYSMDLDNKQLVLITNFVDGASLDKILFAVKFSRKVCYLSEWI